MISSVSIECNCVALIAIVVPNLVICLEVLWKLWNDHQVSGPKHDDSCEISELYLVKYGSPVCVGCPNRSEGGPVWLAGGSIREEW